MIILKNANEEFLAFYKRKLSIETFYTADAIHNYLWNGFKKKYQIWSIKYLYSLQRSIFQNLKIMLELVIIFWIYSDRFIMAKRNVFSVFSFVIDFLFSVCARNKTIQRCFSNNWRNIETHEISSGLDRILFIVNL